MYDRLLGNRNFDVMRILSLQHENVALTAT
jgi:hypothetical protein